MPPRQRRAPQNEDTDNPPAADQPPPRRREHSTELSPFEFGLFIALSIAAAIFAIYVVTISEEVQAITHASAGGAGAATGGVEAAVEGEEITTPEVETIEWNYDDAKFMARVIKRDVPVVLSGSAASIWDAREWTAETLNVIRKPLKNVRRNKNGVFANFAELKGNRPYVLETREEALARYPFGAYEELKAMSMERFTEKVSNSDGYVYEFRGNAMYLGGETDNDFDPEDFTADAELTVKRTNVWLTGGGIVEQAHVVETPTIEVAVVGELKVLLYPPEASPNLYMWPYIHSGTSYSRVDFSNPDPNLYPLFSNAKPAEVTLAAGDALYVPPMWAVHTVASADNDLTVKMSIEVESDETDAILAVMDNAPFTEDDNLKEKMQGVETIIKQLVGASADLPTIAMNILHSRFGWTGGATPFSSEHCRGVKGLAAAGLDRRVKDYFEASHALAVYNRIPDNHLAYWRDNLIEHLVASTVSKEMMEPYIYSCLATEA